MKADIAIMTIRDDEFRAVANRLREYVLEPLDGPSGRTYAMFSVPTSNSSNCDVALVRCPGQGSDISQQVASDMMRDLDPRLLLIVGIAGGVPHNEFTLGDVIISSYIHNFNVNAFTQSDISFDVRGDVHPFVSNIVGSLLTYEGRLEGWNTPESIGVERPSMDPLWVQSHVYGESEWRKDVLKYYNKHFGESSNPGRFPLFQMGSIASSNTLMKNTEIPTTWRKSARSILAVEMEAAGALQASKQIDKQYPVMAIRGISDIIGLDRDERWTPYACQTAGAFTVAFIKAGIVKPRVSTPPTVSSSSQPSRPSTQGKISTSTSANKATSSSGVAPLNLFISYSVEDELFKKQLETHLTTLRRAGVIRPWNSQQMGAGVEWEKDISALIDQSQIILLLISPNFLASDDLYERELQHAMERHASGDARVVPIIIRSVNIHKTPFKDLVALPRNGSPVDTWSNRDQAWFKISEEIQSVCDNLLKGQSNESK
jgi:nucleoside phosphorylase